MQENDRNLPRGRRAHRPDQTDDRESGGLSEASAGSDSGDNRGAGSDPSRRSNSAAEEPAVWGAGIHESTGSTELTGPTESTARIESVDETVLGTDGAPGDTPGEVPDEVPDEVSPSMAAALDGLHPVPRPEFTESVRAAFLKGAAASTPQAAGELDEESLPEELDEALSAWRPRAASAETRARIRAEFLGESVPLGVAPATARAEASGSVEMDTVEAGADQDISGPSTAQGATHTAGAAPQRERAHARQSRAAAPKPARRQSTQLRLLTVTGILAAAAALFLIVRGGLGSSPATNGDGGDSQGQVAEGGNSPVSPSVGPEDGRIADGGADSNQTEVVPEVPDTVPVVEPTWTIDPMSFEGASLEVFLADVLLDGEHPTSIEELERGMIDAKQVVTGDMPLRVRHRNEFVLDLAPGTELDLAFELPDGDDEDAGASRVLFASAGAVRIATGPGFDRSKPLVLRSPHVRTEVVGTIFGVDIADDYTCVCCLEGEVRAKPCTGDSLLRIKSQSTGVLFASGKSMEGDLVAGHRGPLEALVGYWS